MNIREEQDIRDRTHDLVASWQMEQRGAVESLTLEGYLDLVQAAAVVAEEGDHSLQRWVSATRRAGASWEQIGTALGVSRQAAQKRFGESFDEVEGPTERRVTGVTAFNEVQVLDEYGADDWEVVRASWLTLYFRKVDHPVENVRRVTLRRGKPISEMEADGWTHVFSWYPYTYYTRPA